MIGVAVEVVVEALATAIVAVATLEREAVEATNRSFEARGVDAEAVGERRQSAA
jgi:hypothetical protein